MCQLIASMKDAQRAFLMGQAKAFLQMGKNVSDTASLLGLSSTCIRKWRRNGFRFERQKDPDEGGRHLLDQTVE